VAYIRWGGKWIHLGFIFPSSYQNLLKLREIWQSSNKTKMLLFFWDTVYMSICLLYFYMSLNLVGWLDMKPATTSLVHWKSDSMCSWLDEKLLILAGVVLVVSYVLWFSVFMILFYVVSSFALFTSVVPLLMYGHLSSYSVYIVHRAL